MEHQQRQQSALQRAFGGERRVPRRCWPGPVRAPRHAACPRHPVCTTAIATLSRRVACIVATRPRPSADDGRQDLHSAAFDHLVPQAVRQGVDVGLVSRHQAALLEHGKQAADRLGDEGVPRPIRTATDRRFETKLRARSGRRRGTIHTAACPCSGSERSCRREAPSSERCRHAAGSDGKASTAAVEIGALLEGDDCARADMGLNAAKQIRGFGEIHQDPASDDGVEIAGHVEVRRGRR